MASSVDVGVRVEFSIRDVLEARFAVDGPATDHAGTKKIGLSNESHRRNCFTDRWRPSAGQYTCGASWLGVAGDGIGPLVAKNHSVEVEVLASPRQ